MTLDNLQRGLRLTRGTVFYALGVALLVFLLALVLDWVRQKPWREEVAALLTKPDAELPLVPQQAVTWEQQALQALMDEQYRLCQARLTDYQRQQELQNTFQSRWAHQMKTPLAVLDLLLQQYQAGELGCDELMSNLHEVRDKLAAGLELLLHNIRLSQFELDFVVQQVDLLHLLRETINSEKAAFIRYGLFPKISGAGNPVIIETDPKWLQFVLRQIISNALKYSRREGSETTVEFIFERTPTRISLACRDYGIGIPSEDLDRVWQPFFTGINGRRYPEATGMGLYLAKKVCDHLGHELSIDSE
ncbi:MAG: HAMP domain-containing histidine kinase, partial [Firmicutes bacterium]|nr:HAMP domain-containing histidine kinase [Bacillota bacterium]